MAGMGKRMRPHTLTTPKPLLPIAGKPIVQRLVEDIAELSHEPIEEIAFIIGDFGEETEQHLLAIAKELGAKGTICYQKEALGTAHAILCAKDALKGKVIVAFADTLFKANFKLKDDQDGVLWVQKIENPEQFGVVQLDAKGHIVEFIEKPKAFVSDLAMIGIYYFKDGENLAKELQYLIDNNVITGGEYQLPDALRNMTRKGIEFIPGQVDDWMDCGNKNATVQTNSSVLKYSSGKNLISDDLTSVNSIVIPPCYIGKGVRLENCVVGPGVSIGDNTQLKSCIVKDSIIMEATILEHLSLENSMVGAHVEYLNKPLELSMGSYTTYGK
jgi:glucose-1-phosphate thymidylyltransferase